MQDRIVSKNTNLVLLFLVFTSIAVIVSDITIHVSSLRNFVGYVLFPTQRVFSNFLYTQKDVNKNIKSLFLLYRENRALKEKVKDLENIKERFEILMQENKRLKNMLDYKYNTDVSVTAARIIGRSITDWYSSVMIDKGSNDNIKKGSPVIVGSEPLPELVGQVIETGRNYSKILLITDSNSSVSAFLSFADIDGVVEGKNETVLTMKYVPSELDVKKGDVVITSGLGGIFPYGIYIGKVYETEKFLHEEFQHINIKPVVNMHRLRDVFVINNSKLKKYFDR
ncbi:rod shape-determining protein MreC [bacterium]